MLRHEYIGREGNIDTRWKWVVSFNPPGERAPDTHRTEGWVGARAVLDEVPTFKFLQTFFKFSIIGKFSHPVLLVNSFNFGNCL